MRKSLRFTCMLLAVVMLATTCISVFPPLEVNAATEPYISSLRVTPSPAYVGSSVQVKGTVKSGDDYYIKAIQVNVRYEGDDDHGFRVDRVEFDYEDEKTSYSLRNMDSFEIGWYECTGCDDDEYLDIGEHRIDVHVALYDEYGDDAEGFTESVWFNVEELELDTPSISSPNEDDTFYAGDDITFKWGSVSDAEGFMWELYELDRYYGDLLDYGETGTTSSKRKVTIDGDTFKAGNTYTFYVCAYSGDVCSDWEMINLYIDNPPDFSVDIEELLFSSDSDSDTIYLTSDVEWEADVSDSWIELSYDSGSGDKNITVYVDKNTGEHRVGAITITSEVGTITIVVQQDKGVEPTLEVSTANMNVSYEEGYYSFYVTSNIAGWKVSSNVDWLGVSNSSFSLDDTVKISVDESKSIEARTGTITVTGGGITKTVTVTQEGRPAIVGDINGDGEITNKDRFLLNRYLADMAGYTDINKTIADINGDGDVTDADAEYLSRHLTGWVGYEKLPEINTETVICAHTKYTDTYSNTIYVSSTIKTNTTHTYYHVYNRKCNCGTDIGKVQGELLSAEHSYDSTGLCICGAYNDISYKKWTGVNVSGAQANVYGTPSATVRYGYINKDEVVTVIGEYGDKYLIEYTLDGGNALSRGM